MAYTFKELEAWWSGKNYPVGYIKLLITQEDGRTCYANGDINAYIPKSKQSLFSKFSGQFRQQFDDRIRHLNYGPPAADMGSYVQNFDINAGIDLANFSFTKLATNSFELRLTLLRWGNAEVMIKLSKATQAKLYLGWGPTIAAGSSLALYAVSLNGAWNPD